MKRTYYSILEVTESASVEAIRGAYRYLAQRWHPDKNLDQRENSELITKQLNEAFDVLNDAGRRAQYDQWLASRRSVKVQPEISKNLESANNNFLHTYKSQVCKSGQRNKSPFSELLRIFLIATVIIVGFFASLAGMLIFENHWMLWAGLLIMSIVVTGINIAFGSTQHVRFKSVDDTFKKKSFIESWIGTREEWREWWNKIR